MNAKDYWGTSKRLDSQYRREADAVVAAVDVKRQEEAKAQAEQRHAAQLSALPAKVEMWKSVKSGDALFGGRVIVAKKNKFSVVSTSGCKYTIEEVIGSAAAELFRKGA